MPIWINLANISAHIRNVTNVFHVRRTFAKFQQNTIETNHKNGKQLLKNMISLEKSKEASFIEEKCKT